MRPASAPAFAGGSVRPAADACPGALATHQAADGGLTRLRVPGGMLSSTQWQALSDAAATLGDGGLQLTSRGNIEIRGLAPDSERRLAEVLVEHGLLPSTSHERVRNIVSSPLSGLDGRGDPGMPTRRLDAAIQASPALAGLSGRFLFGLDDGRGDIVSLAADLTLIDSAGRAALLIDGCHCGLTVSWDDGPALLVAAAEAFLAESSDAHPWRIADLPDGPRRVAARLGSQLGERADAGTPPPLGIVAGPDRTSAVLAAAPFGRFSTAQADLVATMAEQLRVTPWRSVVLPGLTAERVAGVVAELRDAGLAVDDNSPWRWVTACTGRPGCAKALADVRADARAAVKSKSPIRQGIATHWSGCERRCGHPSAGYVDILATAAGYRTRQS